MYMFCASYTTGKDGRMWRMSRGDMDNYGQSIGTMLAAKTTRLFLQPDGILVGYFETDYRSFSQKKMESIVRTDIRKGVVV